MGAQAKKMAKHAVAAKAALDVTDNRFSALFTQPQFALDPTDPRYAMCSLRGNKIRPIAQRSVHGPCSGRPAQVQVCR